MNTSLLLSKTISEIGNDIRSRKVRVTDITKEALDRIHSMDHRLNSFITINPKAMDLAKKADEQIAEGKYIGPLHGIPIGLKDMIDTNDMKTTMGSEIYKNYIPEQDAAVVSQLKEAGAIIIGKLNTHQFAYGPTGDRSYFGPMFNPYDLTRMAGGSSGGSAAAVAAGFCYGTLGTDTSGSIRVPASFSGLVGMKPTNGLVSQKGIFPLARSLDSTGPMTRTIKDNAILMNVLQGTSNTFYHNGGMTTVDNNFTKKKHEDFTRLIGQNISNMKIGIPNTFFFDNLNSEIDHSIKNVINILKRLGTNVSNIYLTKMEEFSEAQKVIIRYESRQIHEKNLTNYPNMWDDEVKERLTTHIPTYDEYKNALSLQKQSKKEFRQVMDKLDALITPTMSIMPPKINERYVDLGENKEKNKIEDNHIRRSITKLTAPTNLNGLPSLTLPCGFSSKGLPIGVQLIGKENDEALLYQIGYALEQELDLDLSIVDV